LEKTTEELIRMLKKFYKKSRIYYKSMLKQDLFLRSHLIDMGKKVEKDYPEMFKVPK